MLQNSLITCYLVLHFNSRLQSIVEFRHFVMQVARDAFSRIFNDEGCDRMSRWFGRIKNYERERERESYVGAEVAV